MFSKPLSPFTKQKLDRSEETEEFPCFNLNYDLLERFYKKPLTLTNTRNWQQSIAKEKMAEERATTETSKRSKRTSATKGEEPVSIVEYTADELEAFKENMSSENTQKSTSTAVRRLQSWYLLYRREFTTKAVIRNIQGKI